jgi:hypothetical protein
MIVDALVAANETLQIGDAIDNPEEYLGLTDTIVREIERSKAPELAEAQKIIKRIRKRDLYKYVMNLRL